jgi:hypothetical protein
MKNVFKTIKAPKKPKAIGKVVKPKNIWDFMKKVQHPRKIKII